MFAGRRAWKTDQKTDSKNIDEILKEESTIGLKEKLNEYVLPESKNNKEKVEKIYYERLNHEIDIISKMKYSS